jgi:hypothetical protein
MFRSPDCFAFSRERLRPYVCIDGWVFVGYIDEHGEEREASYVCRRCADSLRPDSSCSYHYRGRAVGLLPFALPRPNAAGGVLCNF